ncbi:hypothetical protein AGMMS49992_15850 [Clostridia bacterium]|nr:hypothetical protein AGMMS49992_15850 [Clostridia bacterium]
MMEVNEYQLDGWRIAYDAKSGSVLRVGKNGVAVTEQQAPLFTLVVDGFSTHNNQAQIHNVDLYDIIGEDACLLRAENAENVLTLDVDMGRGFQLFTRWTPEGTRIRINAEIVYKGEGKRRLRWLNWCTNMLDAETLKQVEPFCPGYTMNRSEPYDFHRSVGSYRHAELLSHGLFGEHVPAYRPGILGVYDPSAQRAICSWYCSEIYPCYTPSWHHGETLTRDAQIHCERWMQKGDRQSLGDFYYGVVDGTRQECIEQIIASYQRYGWDRKDDYTEVRQLRVCEVFIGSKSERTLFRDYNELFDRMDEIRALGFNAIEIMPHMPFPSYSVQDMLDIDITYGSADGVRRVTQKAHALGMRVIIDMVFHGPREYDCNDINLPRSPYLDEHPDWFMRHESGVYARTYTRSFDLGNPDYQKHIGDCMLLYLRELGVDGFRLDAQMWSETANWDEACPRQPYEALLAGMRMMDDISARIHTDFPKTVFYTEANGPYSAKGHEYRYNYDMHWMFPALMPIVDPRGASPHTLNLISMNTLSWPDAALWLSELRQTSPKGMAIVYQTDSHDSAEWGGYVGGQYNREAYGEAAHRVLYGIVNFLDGALMSIYGAQKGNEDFYKTLGSLMLDRVMLEGDCDLLGVRADDQKTATILWSFGKDRRLFVGNMENRPKQVALSLSLPQQTYTATDRLSGGMVFFDGTALTLDLKPHDVLVLDITVHSEESI